MLNFHSLSPERKVELAKIFWKDTQRHYGANPYNNFDSYLLIACVVGFFSLVGYCLWN